MIPILYESNETAFTSNGLGRLRDVIECRVVEERNSIFECDFSYPVDGAHFDDIQCGRIIGVTHDDSGGVQPFDIVSYSKPIEGVVEFHAVHISYRQSGMVATGTNINSLADAFSMLGTAQPSNPFTYEADFTSTAYMAAADGVPRSVRQMLGGVEGSILDSYGGEYEFDRFRVILHQSRGVKRDFAIRYGVNMLGYKDDTDFSGTYSSCVPFWKGNYKGNEVIVTGSRVDLGGTAYNGRNICAPLDLSEKFENKPTATQLRNKAMSVMQSRQTKLPAQTIAVDFVRLQDMGYEPLGDLLQCKLCDTVEVIFPRYGMSGSFKIVKTEWNALAGRYEKMELGALSTSLAEALGITNTAEALRSITDLSIGGDLSIEGSAAVGGSLTVGGHSSAIGSGVTSEDTNIAIASGGALKATGVSATLSAGTWAICYAVHFDPAVNTGTYRGMGIRWRAVGGSWDTWTRATIDVPPVTGSTAVGVDLNSTIITEFSGTNRVYELMARSSVANTLTYAWLYAYRIA